MNVSRSARFFSVVIPAHNRGKFLERAILSVLDQTCQDFELVVVDDGSEEGAICEVLPHGDPRVKLVQQPHLGPALARNAGIAHSNGRWIAFLDSDDVWKSCHLEVLMGLCSSFPNAGMVASSIVEMADEMWSYRWPEPARKAPEVIDYFRKSAKKKGVVHSSSVAINRDIIGAVGPFTSFSAGEDLEYWARVALRTPVAKSYETTVAYLRSTGGIMESIQAGRTSLPTPATKSVEDLSPSIKFLWGSLERRDYGIGRKTSIERYINGGIDSSIFSAIFENNCGAVADLRELYVSGWFQYFSTARVAAMAPRAIHLVLRRLGRV